MAFGDIIKAAQGFAGDTITFPTSVSAGNSVLLFCRFRSWEGGEPTSVYDGINAGTYTKVMDYGVYGPSEPQISCYLMSNSLGGTVTITTADTAPFRWVAVEVTGALKDALVSTGNYSQTASNTVTMDSGTVPANSVSFGASENGIAANNLTPSDASWTEVYDNGSVEVFHRKDASSVSTSLSGNLNSVELWATGWVSFTEAATTPTTRKGSTFDIETTLGTITTATLNSVNVFDHVTGQVGTTVSFAGAATDEITTSGEYDLVLGDGTGTETIAVQVNVYGVAPSNNPVQRDGGILASLTGVQLRVTNGANINGTELFYSGTATTDASGNLSNIDLSSTAAADADPVLLHMRTAAGDSIIASETVGLI